MGRKILGAIVGDMVGSTREWKNVKTEDFKHLPKGSRFTDDTVMTLADDLSTGCIISEYDPIDTPAKRQWYERYCEMKPAGIGR